MVSEMGGLKLPCLSSPKDRDCVFDQSKLSLDVLGQIINSKSYVSEMEALATLSRDLKGVLSSFPVKTELYIQQPALDFYHQL